MLSVEKKKAVGPGPEWTASLFRVVTVFLLGVLLYQVNIVTKILTGEGPASKSSAKLAQLDCPSAQKSFFVAPKTRNDLGNLLQERGYKVGAELGVQRAHYSAHMLRQWHSCERYYLVDAWQHQPNYEDFANAPQGEQDKLFNEAKANVDAFKAKTIFMRNYTSEAVKQITEPLDFVYVDARHDYCGVLEDLELYFPKVKSGGIIAGHDYLDAPQVLAISQQNWAKCMDGTINQGAVKGAVDEFFKRHGLQVHVTYQDAPWSTWVVLKP